jgi:hypothetical protein
MLSAIDTRFMFEGPLVKTARCEVQTIKIIRRVRNEIVVRVLDEARLHRENEDQVAIDTLIPNLVIWGNSTSTSMKQACSRHTEYLLLLQRKVYSKICVFEVLHPTVNGKISTTSWRDP